MNTKETTRTTRKMITDFSNGLQGAGSKAISRMTIGMALASCIGSTVHPMRDNGQMGCKMGKES